MCLTSNAVNASTCNASNIPATPILQCTSGSKGIGGTNLSTGWTVHVDNLTRNALDNNVTNPNGLFGANTGTSPNITWIYSGGCTTGAPLNSGSYKIYYTNNTTGCNSLPVYFCAAGNGGTALAGSLAVPVITSPSNSVFTTAVKTISGTTDAGASVTLFINGIAVQNVTATAGGVFTFSNLNLLNGQQLYILTELNTGTVATSKCANQTAMYTVSCFTQAPLINADNNSQLTAGSPITGTSVDAAGTTIRVYTSANVLVATTTVQSNGTWSTANAGTTPAVYSAVAATTYYANAQNGSCGVSTNSSSYAAATGTAIARCGTITGPVTAAAASISGTLTGSFSTTTVNLYLDDVLIGSAVTSGTAWGPITVNSTATNTLYPNGVLKIGVQESGKQEVSCTASATMISCSPAPSVPVYTPMNKTVNKNQTVTYTISNAVAGSFYAISELATGSSLGQGKWATSNGNLSITTNPLTTIGTMNVVFKSSSLSGVTLCSALSATGTITVNDIVLPLTLIEFKGKKQAASILLDWTTSSEINLSRFEIERSTDGHLFEKIGTVTASGNSSAIRSYVFTDNHPSPAAVNYYRLKMIDNDGRFTYSNQLVFMGEGSGMIIEKIGPNPFADLVNIGIVLQQTQLIKIQLVDMAGRVAATKNIQAVEGYNDIVFDGLSKIASGVYVIRITTGDGVLQQKVLKAR
jgi:hypothetical protein